MIYDCSYCEYKYDCFFIVDNVEDCERFKKEKTKQTALNVQGSESFD